MHFDKIHNKGQARLFQSQYLEIFTKTHPLVIWGIYLPVIVGLLYYSGHILAFNAARIVLTFIGGMIFWTLLNTPCIVLPFILWQKAPERENLFMYFMATTTNIRETGKDYLCRRCRA